MYKVSKRMEISAMHQLHLDYESKCNNVHGHNWIITVEIWGRELNENGMLLDFTIIKKLIEDKLDHKNLNQIFSFNPTAENIADFVQTQINAHLVGQSAVCKKVRVQETEGNWAEWEDQNYV